MSISSVVQINPQWDPIQQANWRRVAIGLNQINTNTDSFTSYLPLAGGTMTGNILMGTNSIGGTAAVLSFASGATGLATFTGGIAVGAAGFVVGTLTITDGSIDDTDGSIAFGSTNFTGVGTIGCNEITIADGHGLNLQEDITFTGTTTENLIKFPDGLANALSFNEGANTYMTFVSTNSSESVTIAKLLILSSVSNAGTDTDKFLVLDASNNVDFRTGAEVLSDIGAASSSHTHDGDTLQFDGINSDGGAFAFDTTGDITFNQNLVLSTNSATITHSGTTSLTIASTNGTVIIESVTFTGAAISGATNTNWDAAYTHVSSDGSDHTFIDQSVVSGASPTFDGTNFTGIPASGVTNCVSATANLTDNAIVRGHGGAKVVQTSSILIDDSNNVSGMGTLACGAITSTGALDIGANTFTVNSIEIVGADGEVNKAAIEDSGNWDAAYTHVSSDGTDHSYIDQDVTTTASPTFVALNLTTTITTSGHLLLDCTNYVNIGSTNTPQNYVTITADDVAYSEPGIDFWATLTPAPTTYNCAQVSAHFTTTNYQAAVFQIQLPSGANTWYDGFYMKTHDEGSGNYFNRIGLNTTNPGATLHLVGHTDLAFWVESSGGYISGFEVNDTGSETRFISSKSGGTPHNMYFRFNTTNRMILTNTNELQMNQANSRIYVGTTGTTSRLGINTNSASVELHVKGDATPELWVESAATAICGFGVADATSQCKFISSHNSGFASCYDMHFIFYTTSTMTLTRLGELTLYGYEGNDSIFNMYADDGDDNADQWRMRAHQATPQLFTIESKTSGSWANKFSIEPANRTINWDTSDTAANMQTDIDACGKWIPEGVTLTFQFADGTYTMAQALDWSGFKGGGTINIYGNSGDNSKSSTKNVDLDFTGQECYGLTFSNNGVTINIHYLDIQIKTDSSNNRGIEFIGQDGVALTRYCYLHGNSNTTGSLYYCEGGIGFQCANNMVSDAEKAFRAVTGTMLKSNDADNVVGSEVDYGLEAEAGVVHKVGNQPSSCIVSDETFAVGGVVR